jgi:prophage regulatory protein
MTNLPQMKILKLKEVLELISISKSTLYNEINEGRFPEPIKLSRRSVGWLIEDVYNWRDKKKESQAQPF